MATALPWTQTCSRRRAAYEGCPDAPYYRTRGVTRGRRKGEDERGVENSTQTYCRSLKNRSLSLSVHFYIILPATLCCPFSGKRRGFCPSCAARRMAQTAAHLVTCVIPWVPTRQWVVSVPVPLRYWMAASQDLTAKVHTIIRTTIGQYYVHQAVTRGAPRDQVQPGSVTFIQRFGSAINLMMSS